VIAVAEVVCEDAVDMTGRGLRRRRCDERNATSMLVVPPIAGLPIPQDTLVQMLARVLESAQGTRRSLTVVVAEARGVGQPPDALVAAVRGVTRDTDLLWPTADGGLTVVLVDADGPSGEMAVGRIRRELAAQTRLGIALGRATAAPGIAATELHDLARANLLGLRN
jgi:hypothetical protein